jgi:hypothetical protein
MELQLRVVAHYEYPAFRQGGLPFLRNSGNLEEVVFGAGALESFKVRGGALRLVVGAVEADGGRWIGSTKADRRAYRPTIGPSWRARGRGRGPGSAYRRRRFCPTQTHARPGAPAAAQFLLPTEQNTRRDPIASRHLGEARTGLHCSLAFVRLAEPPPMPLACRRNDGPRRRRAGSHMTEV